MDKKQHVPGDTLPTPKPDGLYRPPKARTKLSFGWLKNVGFVLVAGVAGFFGAWLAAANGWLPGAGQTITESRERILAEGEVVADVAETVSPSVVSIVTETVSSDDLFGPVPQSGAGTGIIISADGYVLTNRHVIPEGVRSVSVVLQDGAIHEEVTVVGRDPINDIAFLKIRNVTDLTAAKLGDSGSMQVGQKVVAIGNALGQFQTTVTSGIISGTGRPVTAGDGTRAGVEQLENLFQTDAAINPGNSGGPLVNLNGEVIGINTAVAQDAEGIGFAIPINDAKGLIKGVLATGELKRAYLGVRYVTITPDVAERLDLAQDQGAYIGGTNATPVISGGPADKAGLKAGDVIIKVNGVQLTDRTTLASQLSRFTPGESVTITYVRDGTTRDVVVKLEELKG